MITRSTVLPLAVVARLIALQDHRDHGGKCGIGRDTMTHAPFEQIRIVARQQADKGLLIGFAQGVELVFEKGIKITSSSSIPRRQAHFRRDFSTGLNMALSLQRPGDGTSWIFRLTNISYVFTMQLTYFLSGIPS